MINVMQELRDAYKLIKAVKRNNMQKYDIKFLDIAMEKITAVAGQLKEQGKDNELKETERD